MKKLSLLPVVMTLMSVPAFADGSYNAFRPSSDRTVITRTVTLGEDVSFDVKTPMADKNNDITPLADPSATQHQVRVIIEPDANGGNKIPSGVWLIKDEYISYQSMRKADNKFNVPAGDYIIQVIFTNNDDAGAILFFPDIKIDADKEIHVNASMADKQISTAFILPSGEKAVLPEDNGFGAIADKPYNISVIKADIHLTYNGLSKGSLQSVIGMGGADYPDLLTLSTNVESPLGEISYVIEADAPGKNGAKYFYLASTTMDKVDASTVLSNDPQFFHKLSTSDIARTPAYDKFGNENDKIGIDFYAYSPSAAFVGGLGASGNSNTDFYICTPPVDFSALHPLTRLYSVDFSDDDEWIFDGISTPFFAYTDKGFEYYAMQDGNTYKSDKPQWETLPFNPALTFSDASGIRFGDNFAVCVTAVQYDPWADVPFSYIAPDCYYGNYGENRTVDLDVVETAVKYNGVLQEFKPEDDLYSWAEKWATNGHTPGVMTYIFTNKNIIVDGMTGQNICEVSFTEDTDDTTPPTLQRIMMRDASGNVTNRFSTNAGASINIVGGDFIKKQESRNTGAYPMTFTYYTFDNVECKVEYAPNGTNTFTGFDVESDPANFFMPGFGEYFSGRLDQISVKSDNGWYDLRVSLTDKAGNTQIQTISPAFKLEKLSGINEIQSTDDGLSVKNGVITSADGAEVKVYNLTGTEIPNSNLRPGLYIARSANVITKIIVR